jgi:hypothetical protein
MTRAVTLATLVLAALPARADLATSKRDTLRSSCRDAGYVAVRALASSRTELAPSLIMVPNTYVEVHAAFGERPSQRLTAAVAFVENDGPYVYTFKRSLMDGASLYGGWLTTRDGSSTLRARLVHKWSVSALVAQITVGDEVPAASADAFTRALLPVLERCLGAADKFHDGHK